MKHALYAALAVCLFAASNGCALCQKGGCCGNECAGNCQDGCHGNCQSCNNGNCQNGCEHCGQASCDGGCCNEGVRSGLFAAKHQGGHAGYGPLGVPFDQYQPTPPPSAAAVAYPYYTNRGPRDFLSPLPRSIGP